MLANPTVKYRARVIYWDTRCERVITKEVADASRGGKRNRLPAHIYRFDSTLEFNVYLKLIEMYGQNRVKVQHPILYIPPGKCYPKGKFWKVDFAIRAPNKEHEYSFYVEAKGIITDGFKDKLPILEFTNPEVFRRLFLVFGSKVPFESKVIRALASAPQFKQFYTLKEFRILKKLR